MASIGFRICQVISPVIICSLYVCLLIRILELNVSGTSGSIFNKAWTSLGLQTKASVPFSKLLVNNIVIVTAFVVLIILITLVILFVFYMQWHSCLAYYFYLPSLIIMSFMSPAFLKQVLLAFNCISLDMFTLVLIVWNFTVLGMIAIFNIYTKAPLYVQQFYLIHNSSLMAVLIVTALPSWAAWILLAFLVLWDLFAVLAPYGPLNLIIGMAEKRGVIEMPGLIYTTDVMEEEKSRAEQEKKESDKADETSGSEKTLTLSVGGTIESDLQFKTNTPTETIPLTSPEKPTQVENVKLDRKSLDSYDSKGHNIGERGVNIGLGDFIFYSLLVGLTCKEPHFDFYKTVACLAAILVGLVVTLIILATKQRVLPALPISIALGLVTAAAAILVPPFSNRLAAEQVFV